MAFSQDGNIILVTIDGNNRESVYVPRASYTQKGIASFSQEHFKVIDGHIEVILGGLVEQTDTPNQLYGTDDNGEQTTVEYSKTAEDNAIVQRDSQGGIIAGNQNNDNYTASLTKVNEKLANFHNYLKTQIINDLGSDATDKPLSANMGKFIKSLIDGRPRAMGFVTYASLISTLNSMGEDQLDLGSSLYVALPVPSPDLWVTWVESNQVAYAYTDDTDFLNAITATNGAGLQIGYFKVYFQEASFLELSDYYTKTEVDALIGTDEKLRDAVGAMKTEDGEYMLTENGDLMLPETKDIYAREQIAQLADAPTVPINYNKINNLFNK